MPGTVDLAPVQAVLCVAAAGVLTAAGAVAVAWRRTRWDRAMIRLARKMERRVRCSTRSKSGATSS